MTNLKEVQKMAEKFNNDSEKIAQELKRIQSIKCRLKKQKFKKNYESEMQEVLNIEQVLKEARSLIVPKKKFTTEYTEQDVEKLTYDETIKAIRSIQSKKTLSKFLTEKLEDNTEYQNACKIEKMLLEHRNCIKPIEETVVKKTDVQTIIDTIESSGKLSQEKLIELLKELV